MSIKVATVGDKLLIIGAGFIGLCAAQPAEIKQTTAIFTKIGPERIAFEWIRTCYLKRKSL
ncbi:MAG: hypothetical protein N3D17_06675 [bacterium]|nr:hypothetical protein [bacterium]